MTVAFNSGEFTSAGTSEAIALEGWFNLSLNGFGSATVSLLRSLDGGNTFYGVEAFTADVENRGHEPESGALYKLICSPYTSGTIKYRISR